MTGGGGVPDFAFPEKNAIFTPDAPIRQKTHAMYRLSQYKETDKMGDLICENYPILLVVSRFGISLGFGDKDIAQVCADNGVDTPTFLAVVNLLLDEDESAAPADAPLSVGALVRYLQNSHAYFLDFSMNMRLRCAGTCFTKKRKFFLMSVLCSKGVRRDGTGSIFSGDSTIRWRPG